MLLLRRPRREEVLRYVRPMRLVVVTLFALLVACASQAAPSKPAPACEPGRQVTCPCAGGGEGVQVCAATGASYEACQCGAPVPPPDVVDGAIEKLKGLKDGVCACTDQACPGTGKAAREAYGESLGRKLRDAEPSKSQMTALLELSKAMEVCASAFADLDQP